MTRLTSETIKAVEVGSLLYCDGFTSGFALLLSKTHKKEFINVPIGTLQRIEYWVIDVVDGESNTYQIEIEEWDIFF